MRKFFPLLALLALTLPVFSQDFQIDSKHSSANFSVKHLLVSTVHGRFGGGVTGTIHYDPQDVTKSTVQAVIQTDTINTDNASRDKDLHSERFFDVAKYPEIKFESTKVEKRGDNYVAVGNLTMKDVTKQIELPFTLTEVENNGKKKLGVDAQVTINRLDYHVNYDPSGTTVSKNVKIEINLEATQQ